MFWIEVENVINSANDVLSEPMDKPIAHLNQVSGEIFVSSNCGSIKTRVISNWPQADLDNVWFDQLCREQQQRQESQPRLAQRLLAGAGTLWPDDHDHYRMIMMLMQAAREARAREKRRAKLAERSAERGGGRAGSRCSSIIIQPIEKMQTCVHLKAVLLFPFF